MCSCASRLSKRHFSIHEGHAVCACIPPTVRSEWNEIQKFEKLTLRHSQGNQFHASDHTDRTGSTALKCRIVRIWKKTQELGMSSRAAVEPKYIPSNARNGLLSMKTHVKLASNADDFSNSCYLLASFSKIDQLFGGLQCTFSHLRAYLRIHWAKSIENVFKSLALVPAAGPRRTHTHTRLSLRSHT